MKKSSKAPSKGSSKPVSKASASPKSSKSPDKSPPKSPPKSPSKNSSGKSSPKNSPSRAASGKKGSEAPKKPDTKGGKNTQQDQSKNSNQSKPGAKNQSLPEQTKPSNYQKRPEKPLPPYNEKLVQNRNQAGQIKEGACRQCRRVDLEYPIVFSCNHVTCVECLIKSLLLTQFKSIENKDKAVFQCRCQTGSATLEFSDLIDMIRKVNEPKPNSNCTKHNQIGEKYCLDCEVWLCSQCISIHQEFNSNHRLSDREVSLKQLCHVHGESCKFYCKICKMVICPICTVKGNKHYEHEFMYLEDFQKLTGEIKNKFKYKNIDELNAHLDSIRERVMGEYQKNNDDVNDLFDEMIDNINQAKDNYNKMIMERKENLLNVLDIISYSFCNFYNDLTKIEQNHDSLKYLNDIVEIRNISTFFSNKDELENANEMLKKYLEKDYLNYRINSTENPYPYTYINYEKFKKDSTPVPKRIGKKKDGQGNLKPYQQGDIKYSNIIGEINDTVYSIIKISIDSMFAAAIGKDICVYNDPSNYKDKFLLTGHSKNILCLAELSPGRIASGSEDKTIKIWNINEKKLEATITGKYEKVDSLLALNENTLAAGVHNTIRVYNTDNKQEIYTLVGHEKSVTCMVKMNDDVILSSSYDNTIKIWDTKLKTCSYTLFGHNQTVYCILLLRDGRLVSGSGSWDKSIKIWNIKERKCEITLFGHKREIRSMIQLSNGFLVTGSVDCKIKVWNLKTKTCVQSIEDLHQDVIFCLCLLGDNKFVSGGRDKALHVWKC